MADRKFDTELDLVFVRIRTNREKRAELAALIGKKGPIRGCKVRREPDNKVDENALAVFLPDGVMGGRHIGYLRAASAELLSPRIDAGTLAVSSCQLESLDANDDNNSGRVVVTFRERKPQTPKKGRRT